MKCLIAALSVALASTAAFAETGKPFEQIDIDRAVPNVQERAASIPSYSLGSAPYEQLLVDRSLPNIVSGEPTRLAAVQGDTRSDVEIAVDGGSEEQAASSPFANDPHFVAPPQ